jgi:hypothetical protein
MVVVAGSNIFGGGVFSTAHARRMKMVGQGQRAITEIKIKPIGGAKRTKTGAIEFATHPPYLPNSAAEPLHPGANSLCFAIQLAHLMGCSPIYAVGFTLQNGVGYHFGHTNPVTRKSTFYEQKRALAWCAWYEAQHPGRVLLDPGFSGPIYDIFQKANFDANQERAGSHAADDGGHEPESGNEHAAEEEPVRHDGNRDRPLHEDGVQPSGECEAAEVHGDVRPLTGQGEGAVPVAVGR